MTHEKSTVELLADILGDFDKDTNTDVALDVYMHAKRVANAATVAQKLTQEFAVAALEKMGGRAETHYAKCHLKREFAVEFSENKDRESLLLEIEMQSNFLKTLKDTLSEMEKQMLDSGLAHKKEIGQSLSVTLLDKI